MYIGKGVHYFPKAQVGEFKVEAQNIKVGDKIIITGPTTGVVEHEITELMVDEKPVDTAARGVNITFPIKDRIRRSDKLYKMVANEEA